MNAVARVRPTLSRTGLAPAQGTWFSTVGRALTRPLRARIEALLRADSLLAGAEIAAIDGWREVARIVGAADWDTQWSDHEEAERERLWQCAAERMGEDSLFATVTASTDAVTAAVHRAAALAAERGGVDDPRLIGAASGAALMAVHHWVLAREAGEGEAHLFTRQYALYRAGRWPLGCYRGRYLVF